MLKNNFRRSALENSDGSGDYLDDDTTRVGGGNTLFSNLPQTRRNELEFINELIDGPLDGVYVYLCDEETRYIHTETIIFQYPEKEITEVTAHVYDRRGAERKFTYRYDLRQTRLL